MLWLVDEVGTKDCVVRSPPVKHWILASIIELGPVEPFDPDRGCPKLRHVEREVVSEVLQDSVFKVAEVDGSGHFEPVKDCRCC